MAFSTRGRNNGNDTEWVHCAQNPPSERFCARMAYHVFRCADDATEALMFLDMLELTVAHAQYGALIEKGLGGESGSTEAGTRDGAVADRVVSATWSP